MRIEIPFAVRQILEKLGQSGYEGYIVGGCVRDMLLGRSPEDWDITTSARPEQVKALFKRTIDTGIQHGTVTVMMDHVGYEVTTYRVDGTYSDGRHPDQVVFTPSLIEDLKRRDFTINAMAYSPAAGLVDEFQGQEDLRAGIIRCVGNPAERFSEDALRMLRAIRFSAQLGFEIDPKTLEAIRLLAANLEKVSRERVQVELTKLLMSANPQRMSLVYDTGLAPFVGEAFGGLGETGWRPSLSGGLPVKKPLRWAAFLREAGPEQARKILKGLKLDNDTISRTETLVRFWAVPLSEKKPDIRRGMSVMGAELFGDLLDLKEGLAGSKETEEAKTEEIRRIRLLKDEILADGDCLSLKDLALTGRDVMEETELRGPLVGQCLNRLLQLVLEDPKRNQREYLLQSLREFSIIE